jgi:hypothetical protein
MHIVVSEHGLVWWVGTGTLVKHRRTDSIFREVDTELQLESIMGRDCVEYVGGGRRTILKWVL